MHNISKVRPRKPDATRNVCMCDTQASPDTFIYRAWRSANADFGHISMGGPCARVSTTSRMRFKPGCTTWPSSSRSNRSPQHGVASTWRPGHVPSLRVQEEAGDEDDDDRQELQEAHADQCVGEEIFLWGC